MNITQRIKNFINTIVPGDSKFLVPLNKEFMVIKEIDDSMIIATKNGLYSLFSGKLYLLLKGEFYGITYVDDKVFVYQNINSPYQKKSKILSFKIKRGKISGCLKRFIRNLPNGCHQIDYYKDAIYISNTYNNSILKYDLAGRKKGEYFPLGKLNNGRESHNYGHLNSIYFSDSKVFLFSHNETKKTGRKSEILVCNSDFVIEDRISLNATNGHNVIYKNGLYYCDSYGHSVYFNEDKIADIDMFSRGLALSGNYIFIGGSEYAERSERRNKSGKVYKLDYLNNKIEFEFSLPGMVCEIRILPKDYSLSQFSGT